LIDCNHSNIDRGLPQEITPQVRPGGIPMNAHQREYSSAIRAGIKHMNATWDSIAVSKVNDL
jgi:hypothetical protein